MRVSRKKATYQSGPKKGKLKPGCRFVKGDGAICKGAKAALKTSKRKSKKSAGGKRRKATGAARRARKGTAPATPKMTQLNAIRRYWNQAENCQQKRAALRELKKQFQYMARSGAKPKRGETAAQAATRRWGRWQSEYRNKLETTEAFCSGRPRSKMRMIGPGMVNGLSGSAKKKHPCARPNPPAWCSR